jgi:multicomponent Na+:H+ antiporter subunit F
MQAFYLALALFLLLNLGAGMWRVLLGPTTADHMLAAQLFGTTAVAVQAESRARVGKLLLIWLLVMLAGASVAQLVARGALPRGMPPWRR